MSNSGENLNMEVLLHLKRAQEVLKSNQRKEAIEREVALFRNEAQVYILQMYQFFAQTPRTSCPIIFCQNICKYVKIYKIYVKTS